MERFTISHDESPAQVFDSLIHDRGYANRSEAVRDMIRRELESRRLEKEESPTEWPACPASTTITNAASPNA